MYSKKLNILMLTDEKLSSENQCNGVINIIKNKVNSSPNILHQKLKLQKVKKLPNFLIYFLLKIKFIDTLKLGKYKPDLIISCGRVTAPFSLLIKKMLSCKIIHILKPYILYKEFDLIILPKHDNFPKLPNIIHTHTALVNESNFKIAHKKKMAFSYAKIPYSKEIVTILIGGPLGNGTFRVNDSLKLINYLKQNKKKSRFYCFLFSRRTSEDIKNIFRQNFRKMSFIWDEIEPNPYWFCLGLSKYIIVTGDSISMTSESIASQKNIFVFMPKKLRPKIKKFQDSLFREKITREYNGDLFEYKVTKIKNEYKTLTKKISKLVLPSFMNP